MGEDQRRGRAEDEEVVVLDGAAQEAGKRSFLWGVPAVVSVPGVADGIVWLMVFLL